MKIYLIKILIYILFFSLFLKQEFNKKRKNEEWLSRMVIVFSFVTLIFTMVIFFLDNKINQKQIFNQNLVIEGIKLMSKNDDVGITKLMEDLHGVSISPDLLRQRHIEYLLAKGQLANQQSITILNLDVADLEINKINKYSDTISYNYINIIQELNKRENQISITIIILQKLQNACVFILVIVQILNFLVGLELAMTERRKRTEP